MGVSLHRILSQIRRVSISWQFRNIIDRLVLITLVLPPPVLGNKSKTVQFHELFMSSYGFGVLKALFLAIPSKYDFLMGPHNLAERVGRGILKTRYIDDHLLSIVH
ncbi:hypothetical protein F5Y11DRAFT_192683 [Daldinia sp. FL1419]|nr:hypothetical protein F5Y11DRAFT_192683 [Daldinia sp. FL1419]